MLATHILMVDSQSNEPLITHLNVGEFQRPKSQSTLD